MQFNILKKKLELFTRDLMSKAAAIRKVLPQFQSEPNIFCSTGSTWYLHSTFNLQLSNYIYDLNLMSKIYFIEWYNKVQNTATH